MRHPVAFQTYMSCWHFGNILERNPENEDSKKCGATSCTSEHIHNAQTKGTQPQSMVKLSLLSEKSGYFVLMPL